jgi:branched-subunit amino acid ABC-type transport system permease component
MTPEKELAPRKQENLWIKIKDNLPAIAVIVITILIGIAVGIRGGYPQVVQFIITGGMWALLSVGLALVFGVMNIPHFAHGESFMVGAYVAYFVFTPLNNYLQQNPNQFLSVVAPLIAILAAGLAGFVLGIILERLLFYPLRSTSKPGEWVMNAFLLTVGISFVMINTIKLIPFLGTDSYNLGNGYWYIDTIKVYPQAKREDALEGLDKELYGPVLEYLQEQEGEVLQAEVLDKFDITRAELEVLKENRLIGFGTADPLRRAFGIQGLNTERLIAFTISVLSIAALWFFLRRTRTGRAIRAVSQDEVGAQMMGINLNFIYPLTFGLATAMASIAGGSLLEMFGANPDMGQEPLYTAWFVVMMAGLGNIVGAIVGGFIVAILQTATNQFTVSALLEVIPTIVMIIILIVVPSGIFGSEVKGIQEQ